MDTLKLARRHLEDAITLGYITLANRDIRELSASQILMVSRIALKDGLLGDSDSSTSEATNAPVEMFTSPLSAVDNRDALKWLEEEYPKMSPLEGDFPELDT